MLDPKSLILIAHSDGPTLMALYTLLDTEGYFVAPCFSKDELLESCARYKPELVMTSNPLSGDEGGRLLETIQEHSPKTRILLLPEVLSQDSMGPLLGICQSEEPVGISEARPVHYPPVPLNGF
jgi:DNA-binding NtrC family response regulator